MNLNISHIAGLCLGTLRLINRPSTYIGAILFLAFIKVISILLRTIFYERKLIIRPLPKTITKLSKKHELTGRIKIVSDKKPLAFCYGFFHPEIYLSTALIRLMNSEELEAIILHEKYHLLKKDNMLLITLNFIKQLFLPFPLFSDFLENMTRIREIKADHFGVNTMGKREPMTSAFKKLLNFNNDSSYLLHYSSAFTNHEHFENRIHALFGKKDAHFSFKRKNMLISLFSLIILIGFFFSPWQKTQAKNQEQKSLVCLKNTDCSKHC